MRRVVLGLAVAALVFFAANTASAQLNSRIVVRNYFTIQDNTGYAQQGYQSWSVGTQGTGYNFNDAVRRIQAKYSPYRYNPHPRTYYKSEPSPYDYMGW